MGHTLWKYLVATAQVGETPHRGRLYSVDITCGSNDASVTIYDTDETETSAKTLFYGETDQSYNTGTNHFRYTPGRYYSTGLYVVISGTSPKVVVGYD